MNLYPLCSNVSCTFPIMGLMTSLNISSIFSTSTTFVNSELISIKPSSSNSQTMVWETLSIDVSMYMDTDFFLPMLFINLKIVAFFKYGIFRPSVEILSANNL